MKRDEKLLCKRILSDVALLEARAFDTVPAVSVSHSATFSEEIGKARERADRREDRIVLSYRQTVAAILVAVLVLLTATACVFRDEIRDFFLSVSDGWISYRAERKSSDPKRIEIHYEPVLSDDYQIAGMVKNNTFSEIHFRSLSSGEPYDNVIWTQALTSAVSGADGENDRVIVDNGITYHIVDSQGLLRVTWLANGYSFVLTLTEEMTDEELLDLLDTVHPVE